MVGPEPNDVVSVLITGCLPFHMVVDQNRSMGRSRNNIQDLHGGRIAFRIGEGEVGADEKLSRMHAVVVRAAEISRGLVYHGNREFAGICQSARIGDHQTDGIVSILTGSGGPFHMVAYHNRIICGRRIYI